MASWSNNTNRNSASYSNSSRNSSDYLNYLRHGIEWTMDETDGLADHTFLTPALTNRETMETITFEDSYTQDWDLNQTRN